MCSSLGACVIFAWAFSWSLISVVAQGNISCKTSSLDWYTSTVGETPCQTYQRLRQICNAAYTVGSLSPSTPPDSCNDQVASCCCNSISFALSMLCLNCQQGVGTGINGDNGIDAGAGAYQEYIGTCSPNVNQSLPNDVQAAVCNNKIKIDDDIYTLFWGTGAWFYMYTRETIQKNQEVFAGNTFTHCASTTINNNTSVISTASATSTTTNGAAVPTNPPQPAHSFSLSMAAKAGIITGGIVAVLLFIGISFKFFQRRRNRYSSPDKIVSATCLGMEQAAYQIEPFRGHLGASRISYNNTPPTTDSSESGYAHPSQPLLPSSNGSQLSRRSEKGGPPVQPDSNNLSMGHSLSPSMSQSPASAAPISSLLPSDAFPERHADGGPLLGRSPSGRLPPAYGEQRDDEL